MTPEQALTKALRIVGGATALATAISTPAAPITGQAVGQWAVCPKDRVLAVQAAVAAAVARQRADLRRPPTAHDLRPDLYPRKCST